MDMKIGNAKKKVEQLAPFLSGVTSILDFGCGDMLFARMLRERFPRMRISGIDIVDFGSRPAGISFLPYDGKKLPCKNASFDAVVSWHVLHHTKDPFYFLDECLRVSKKTLFLVEPVYRHPWELPGMKIMDFIFNVWKDKSISMPFAFASKEQWLHHIKDAGWTCEIIVDVELLPRWSPTGRSLLFVCTPSRTFARHKKHAAR